MVRQTAVIHHDDIYHEDSTQQPLLPVHQPGQDMKEKYLTNTSRDGILMVADTNRESEHDPLNTGIYFIMGHEIRPFHYNTLIKIRL